MHEVIRTYQHHDNQRIGWIRVQCDTDFVGRNEEFLEFVDNVIMGIVSFGEHLWIGDFFYKENPVTSQTFGEDIVDARKKFAEDIRITHFEMQMTQDAYNRSQAEQVANGSQPPIGLNEAMATPIGQIARR